jgi:hypothetical protein
MFDGDDDGSGAMLPWVSVFVGLQRNIKTVKMKEKKMKKKNRVAEDECEDDEQFRVKEDEIDEERVIVEQLGIDVIGDEKGYWKSGSELIFSVNGCWICISVWGERVKINGSDSMQSTVYIILVLY